MNTKDTLSQIFCEVEQSKIEAYESFIEVINNSIDLIEKNQNKEAIHRLQKVRSVYTQIILEKIKHCLKHGKYV